MIYIIRDGASENVKIGYAKNVAERLKTLRTGNSRPLTLLRYLQGDRNVEAAFHRKFSKNRIDREWFRYDPEMLTWMPDNARADLVEDLSDVRRGQTLRLNKEAHKQLKLLAIDQCVPAHDLIVEAVNMLFLDRGVPPIA